MCEWSVWSSHAARKAKQQLSLRLRACRNPRGCSMETMSNNFLTRTRLLFCSSCSPPASLARVHTTVCRCCCLSTFGSFPHKFVPETYVCDPQNSAANMQKRRHAQNSPALADLELNYLELNCFFPLCFPHSCRVYLKDSRPQTQYSFLSSPPQKKFWTAVCKLDRKHLQP